MSRGGIYIKQATIVACFSLIQFFLKKTNLIVLFKKLIKENYDY